MSLCVAGTDICLDEGTRYLFGAAHLWSLVDPKRADAIRWWIRNEWAADDEDPDVQVYDTIRLRDLLGLLDGLDDALRAELTDQDWRVDQDTALRISQNKDWLVDSWDEEHGKVYTLANRVSEIHQLDWLVRQALAMDRALVVR
jgi:hypothetical protein